MSLKTIGTVLLLLFLVGFALSGVGVFTAEAGDCQDLHCLTSGSTPTPSKAPVVNGLDATPTPSATPTEVIDNGDCKELFCLGLDATPTPSATPTEVIDNGDCKELFCLGRVEKLLVVRAPF